MHDGFKANESVCLAKFEQQCVITIIEIFENEPKHGGSMKNYFMITY